jgi:hypothetical protein
MYPIVAEGTTLEYSTNGTVWNLVGHLISLEGPGITVPVVERTTLSDLSKRKRPSKIPDMGELSGSLKADPDNPAQEFMLAQCLTPPHPGEFPQWRITYMDEFVTHCTDVFDGFVSAFEATGFEEESDPAVDFTITVDDLIVRTPGSSP